MYKTTDGGSNWKKLKKICSNTDLVISGSRLLATHRIQPGSRPMVSVSGDLGKTWKDIQLESEIALPRSIAVDPGNPDLIYIGGIIFDGKTRGVIYKSSNGGGKWTKILDSTDKYPYLTKIALAPSRQSDPNTIYICSQKGLHKSGDGGNKWISLYPNPCSSISITKRGDLYLLKNRSIVRYKEKEGIWETVFRYKNNQLYKLYIDEINNRFYIASMKGLVSFKLDGNL